MAEQFTQAGPVGVAAYHARQGVVQSHADGIFAEHNSSIHIIVCSGNR